MSIILKPELNLADAVLITTAAAVAVSEAIDKFSDYKPLIKWVNDIYINNKKWESPNSFFNNLPRLFLSFAPKYFS